MLEDCHTTEVSDGHVLGGEEALREQVDHQQDLADQEGPLFVVGMIIDFGRGGLARMKPRQC